MVLLSGLPVRRCQLCSLNTSVEVEARGRVPTDSLDLSIVGSVKVVYILVDERCGPRWVVCGDELICEWDVKLRDFFK